jgi:hypothetical protein
MKRMALITLLAIVPLVACSKSSNSTTSAVTESTAATAKQDLAAQSLLRDGFVTAMVYFTDDDTFSGYNPSIAHRIDSTLSFVDGQPAAQGVVSIDAASGNVVVLSTQSARGATFCVAGSGASGPRSYGTVDAQGATSLAGCTGEDWGGANG